ncbi:pyridoxamine 5'-phosphate oxidase [Streptomyces sp. Je 1-79]|uniref:pyridoxamine 5'-phosphate oxidase n=1 Tax=Streptomyces sp. Je 1-79 TaxID=2943847 RepID=UPI0021A537C6|nr:pyridoxamine 5'-phosphate oxidase [Streptomyces sp. Je 1-79]MCT4357749.1 pyridoxamine 5'-phosphate oxidase [Streptomyces sp. Je 1-79]
MREQYRTTELTVADLAPEPIEQFTRWFKIAATSPAIHEPNAMVVSTATPDGRPSSRTVLLKHYDEAGFVFYTNYASRKGGELAANPSVALLFPWHPLARQIIVTGRAVRTGRDETVAYFRTRPHGSQLGAWASRQSSVIASRDELLARYEELAARYPADEQVPVPPEWGGIRVVPETVEFWQGHENRLHDRLRYVRVGEGEGEGGQGEGAEWRVERLSP